MNIYTKELKSCLQDVVIFIIGLGLGVCLDYMTVEIHSVIHSQNPDALTKTYLAGLGLFQVFINILIIHLMKKLDATSGLFTMGLFIPQTIILSSVYGTPYVSQNITRKFD